MGHLELFVQRTFAEETERVTDGAVGWQDSPEIRIKNDASDGFLVFRPSHQLAQPSDAIQPGAVSGGAMGPLARFAQRTFAEETERITGYEVRWQEHPEIRIEKVPCGGLLMIRRPHHVAQLAAPWPQAQPHDEVMLELKLPGKLLDRQAVAEAMLRQQARLVQRLEEQDASWLGHEPLWLVAPHLPEWLDEMRSPMRFAPGCYWIEPPDQNFLWIAANELPLLDELIPFLMARSGQALDDFCQWLAPHRSPEWTLTISRMLTNIDVDA